MRTSSWKRKLPCSLWLYKNNCLRPDLSIKDQLVSVDILILGRVNAVLHSWVPAIGWLDCVRFTWAADIHIRHQHAWQEVLRHSKVRALSVSCSLSRVTRDSRESLVWLWTASNLQRCLTYHVYKNLQKKSIQSACFCIFIASWIFRRVTMSQYVRGKARMQHPHICQPTVVLSTISIISYTHVL